jgi:hypothetical protein
MEAVGFEDVIIIARLISGRSNLYGLAPRRDKLAYVAALPRGIDFGFGSLAGLAISGGIRLRHFGNRLR